MPGIISAAIAAAVVFVEVWFVVILPPVGNGSALWRRFARSPHRTRPEGRQRGFGAERASVTGGVSPARITAGAQPRGYAATGAAWRAGPPWPQAARSLAPPLVSVRAAMGDATGPCTTG